MTHLYVASALAPAWVVLPLAVLTLLILALHLSLLRADTNCPPCRRRIRTVNGVVMMSLVPVFAYAIGIASPDTAPREFAIAWMFTLGLTGLMAVMACIDVLNTARLRSIERRKIREDLSIARQNAIAQARERGGVSRP